MSGWSLLLCEGPHDQEFLCCLATIGRDWTHVKRRPAEVPESFERESFKYLYLTRKGRALVISSMNGIPQIIPERRGGDTKGHLLAELSKDAHAFGIILDADSVGKKQRTQAVRTHYSDVVAAAASAEHGQVVDPSEQSPDPRKFGLWIASDNDDRGSLDDLIRKAAEEMHPALTPVAEVFVGELGVKAGHQWGQYKQKAVLASLGQLWQAGGSLASAISARREKWVSRDLAEKAPFNALADFLSKLVE